mmetsp:Transcript_4036/g.7081  ORF Transcript_4036/g.7081 Transcript_4036/m.7081 type:complete len:202 (-) Transcript_4036:1481-2086(-)
MGESSSIRNGVSMKRVQRELEMIEKGPPTGISAWPESDSLHKLGAEIQAPKDCPYEDGVFQMEVQISNRYPFEPPVVHFKTPIYHPNVDSAGRICLDTLNMPPKGAWKPSLNLMTLLVSIQQLIAEPNADDGLVPDITNQYKTDYLLFERIAREHTRKYAIEGIKKRSLENDGSSDFHGEKTAKQSRVDVQKGAFYVQKQL